jgi:hypothetical protein
MPAHWRSYGDDRLASGREALDEPFAAFPSMRHDGCGGRAGRAELLTGIEATSSRDRGPALPVRLQPGARCTRLTVGQPPGRTFPVSRNRAQVVAFTIAASLIIAPAVAGTPIYLSADPPKAKIDSGPSLLLGRVGPDPCPGGLCRTEPSGLYNFITRKGPRPIEPVPGILLSIPLGNAAR